jgi:hypothetical protein
MHKRLVTAILFACLVVAARPLWAFGHEGHETTGAIAAQLIAGKPAEQAIARLLKPNETLASAAVWADCAKGFRYCHASPTAEMRAYAFKNPDHHRYHFADIPFEEGRYRAQAVGADPEDVVHILTQAIGVLQGRDDALHNPYRFTPREALFLVAHLTGDIHQPLHVGAAYVNANNEFVDPRSPADITSGKVAATEGANWFLLGSHNLHGLWDSDLVRRAMRREHATSPEAFAQALMAKGFKPPADRGDPATWPARWADESVRLAGIELEPVVLKERRDVEDRGGFHAVWTIGLPSSYIPRATVQVEKQLYDAGYRMVEIFTSVWP